MKLLKQLKDADFPYDHPDIEIRSAARAVLFDDKNFVPILFVSKHNYHKLPGGGIKPSEDKMKGLEREVLEEVGSNIKVSGEIGKIVEYRSKENFDWIYDLKQTSYCYLGKITSKGTPKFTKTEINDGFQLIWLTLDQAISVLSSDQPNNQEGKFIRERDLTFLSAAKDLIVS